MMMVAMMTMMMTIRTVIVYIITIFLIVLRPVSVDEFIDHVEMLHRDSNLGFSDEYKVRQPHI